MPAPRKENPKQRVLKIIIPPTMDAALQELKGETEVLVAEHVRQAINVYLSFRQPGKGVDIAQIYALSMKAKEENMSKK